MIFTIVYLHLGDLLGKCIGIYSIHGAYGLLIISCSSLPPNLATQETSCDFLSLRIPGLWTSLNHCEPKSMIYPFPVHEHKPPPESMIYIMYIYIYIDLSFDSSIFIWTFGAPKATGASRCQVGLLSKDRKAKMDGLQLRALLCWVLRSSWEYAGKT